MNLFTNFGLNTSPSTKETGGLTGAPSKESTEDLYQQARELLWNDQDAFVSNTITKKT